MCLCTLYLACKHDENSLTEKISTSAVMTELILEVRKSREELKVCDYDVKYIELYVALAVFFNN